MYTDYVAVLPTIRRILMHNIIWRGSSEGRPRKAISGGVACIIYNTYEHFGVRRTAVYAVYLRAYALRAPDRV